MYIYIKWFGVDDLHVIINPGQKSEPSLEVSRRADPPAKTAEPESEADAKPQIKLENRFLPSSRPRHPPRLPHSSFSTDAAKGPYFPLRRRRGARRRRLHFRGNLLRFLWICFLLFFRRNLGFVWGGTVDIGGRTPRTGTRVWMVGGWGRGRL